MICEHWLCLERFCLLFQRAIAFVYPVHEGERRFQFTRASSITWSYSRLTGHVVPMVNNWVLGS